MKVRDSALITSQVPQDRSCETQARPGYRRAGTMAGSLYGRDRAAKRKGGVPCG